MSETKVSEESKAQQQHNKIKNTRLLTVKPSFYGFDDIVAIGFQFVIYHLLWILPPSFNILFCYLHFLRHESADGIGGGGGGTRRECWVAFLLTNTIVLWGAAPLPPRPLGPPFPVCGRLAMITSSTAVFDQFFDFLMWLHAQVSASSTGIPAKDVEKYIFFSSMSSLN